MISKLGFKVRRLENRSYIRGYIASALFATFILLRRRTYIVQPHYRIAFNGTRTDYDRGIWLSLRERCIL